jgi:hypothetical protein
MEVLEVKDGVAVVRGDEVQSLARSLGAGLGGLAIAAEALGEAPRPNGHRRCEQPQGHLSQHSGDPLLFNGANVREWPAGLEDPPNRLGCAALGCYLGTHLFYLLFIMDEPPRDKDEPPRDFSRRNFGLR